VAELTVPPGVETLLTFSYRVIIRQVILSGAPRPVFDSADDSCTSWRVTEHDCETGFTATLPKTARQSAGKRYRLVCERWLQPWACAQRLMTNPG
jgi:hypothetical protein